MISVFCRTVRQAAVLCAFVMVGGYSSLLQAQDAGSITAETQAALTATLATPAAGAKDADVTIIEFFDYNCPFCKKTAPELQRLLHADPKVRIVHKEWPIFGDASTYASRMALAANWQGKYLAAHDALIAVPHDLEETSDVDSVLRGAGIDMERLRRDSMQHSAEIDAILSRSFTEAQRLGVRGTPVFVIGRQLVPRSLTLPLLRQLVANARAAQAAL
ncbi:MAG TPA: DsbA family protein [Steroidobacteraceae bacterium]